MAIIIAETFAVADYERYHLAISLVGEILRQAGRLIIQYFVKENIDGVAGSSQSDFERLNRGVVQFDDEGAIGVIVYNRGIKPKGATCDLSGAG